MKTVDPKARGAKVDPWTLPLAERIAAKREGLIHAAIALAKTGTGTASLSPILRLARDLHPGELRVMRTEPVGVALVDQGQLLPLELDDPCKISNPAFSLWVYCGIVEAQDELIRGSQKITANKLHPLMAKVYSAFSDAGHAELVRVARYPTTRRGESVTEIMPSNRPEEQPHSPEPEQPTPAQPSPTAPGNPDTPPKAAAPQTAAESPTEPQPPSPLLDPKTGKPVEQKPAGIDPQPKPEAPKPEAPNVEEINPTPTNLPGAQGGEIQP